MSEHILTHKHQTHKHQTHNHAASGWRIHCGVEVTELSTNKQLSLSFHPVSRGPHVPVSVNQGFPTTSGYVRLKCSARRLTLAPPRPCLWTDLVDGIFSQTSSGTQAHSQWRLSGGQEQTDAHCPRASYSMGSPRKMSLRPSMDVEPLV